jgi:Rrf2 family transcriptional regulator, nitric oxide-sensitive transcriptional repressor
MLQLTRRADYALRLLIHLAGIEGGRAQIAQIAEAQAISRTHLMKIANDLTHAGFTEAVRGRGGGIRLGRDPREINLGDVIETMEPPCPLVDCTSCMLVQGCGLPAVLDRASAAFRAEFARHSLADIIGLRGALP